MADKARIHSLVAVFQAGAIERLLNGVGRDHAVADRHTVLDRNRASALVTAEARKL